MIGILQIVLGHVRRRPAWQYTLLAFIGVGLGATGFSLTQHVSWFIGWYWAVVTATTVGYGDVVPHNAVGRVIAIATMLVVIPLLAAAFAEWSSSMASVRLGRLLGMYRVDAHDHWVVLGYTSLVPHLMPELLSHHPNVVLIANDIDRGHLPDHPGMEVLVGDPTNPHVLAKGHLASARQILVVGETDGEVLITAIEAHKLAPLTSMLAVTERQNAVHALRDLGIDAIDTQSWLNQFIIQRLEADIANHADE